MDDLSQFVREFAQSSMTTMIAHPIVTACVVLALFALGWVRGKQ